MSNVEHPGVILNRMLEERGVTKRELAQAIGEYPQLLGDVTLGKRKMNPSLSIRIGHVLCIDEDYLMILQTKYDLAQERTRLNANDYILKRIER
ncbi:MAG: addiction module antidote protein, HigA family [Rikenellaceae bacterium]